MIIWEDIVSGKCEYITQYFWVTYIEVLTALKQSVTRSSGGYCEYIHNVGYLWAKSQGGALIIWEDIVSVKCKYIAQILGVTYKEVLTALNQSVTRSSGCYCE